MTRRTSWLPSLVALLPSCLVAWAQPKVLYEKQSAYNTIVVSEDRQGLRTLRFERNGARQSVSKVGDPNHIELPYVRSLLVSLALVQDPERVLVIGVGGGTFPSFLHRHFPSATIDAVDIDPDVVDVAKRFFGFREDERLHAHVSDGRRFVEECELPYDLIVLDAYGSESIPYHLATREFLLAVRQALTPRGIVAGNVWGRFSNPLYDSMVRTYGDVFGRVYVLDVSGAGNKIVFGLPNERRIDRKALIRRAETISQQKEFAFDLGELIRYGFGSARTKSTGGRVLADKSSKAREMEEMEIERKPEL